MYKNYLKSNLFSLVSFLVLNLIVTVLNYIGLINLNIVNILKYIIPFISALIGGYKIGFTSNTKGWLEGLKIGLELALIIFLINLIFYDINIKQIIIYVLIISGSTIGGMMGINKHIT